MKDEYIQENNFLRSKIKELNKTVGDLERALEETTETNRLLVDAINKHNIGEIAKEHIILESRIRTSKKKQEEAEQKLESYKQEYRKRYSDVLNKQSDIDKYISLEADKRVSRIKFKYANKKKALANEYSDKIKDNDRILGEKIRMFEAEKRRYILMTTSAIILSILVMIIAITR